LKYQRFYDWPPELEYARVDPCDAPESDPAPESDLVAHLEADENDIYDGSSPITTTTGAHSKALWRRPRKLGAAVAKGVSHTSCAAVSTVKKSPRVALQGVSQVPSVAAKGVKGVSRIPAAAIKGVSTRMVHRKKKEGLDSIDESVNFMV
jgi:hypothetical protein